MYFTFGEYPVYDSPCFFFHIIVSSIQIVEKEKNEEKNKKIFKKNEIGMSSDKSKNFQK